MNRPYFITTPPKPRTRVPALVLTAIACLSPGLLSAQEPQTTEQSVIAPLAQESLLLDVVRAGDRLVTVGERGHVLLSDDQGQNWRQVVVPTRTTLTAVSFTDPQNGWAVGHDSVILHSSDGGEHWSLQYSDPDEQSPLLDISFGDPKHGIAVGAYGQFLVTDDGGAHWQPQAVHGEDDFHLNAIDGAFLAAEAGNLYRKDGTAWQTLPSPYEGSFFGVLPLSDDSLLMFGLRGHLFRSDDRGATWTPIDTGLHAALTAGLVTSTGRTVLVGHGGTVLWSDDGGQSFKSQRIPDRAALSAVVETADGKLLAVGQRGLHPFTLPAKAQP
jgi:photosystem II stability/assembly factor-like uncharacterized protein